jgi:ABC-2 type transport system permease protein
MFSISNVITIWKRELKGYFYTPLAWVFIGVFTLVMSFMFGSFLNLYQSYTAASMMGQSQTITIDRLSEAFYMNMHVILMFFLPFFTMRAFTEEARNNTFALLLTSPVKVIDIVLAKVAGAKSVLVLMLAMTWIFPAFLFLYAKDGKPDLMIILSTYAGLFLAGMFYMVWGILFSSVTDSQLVAVVLSFCWNFGAWLVSLGAQSSSGQVKEFLQQFSISEHFQSFVKGAPELKGLVFLGTVILFGIFLTHRSVDSRSWRS